MNITLLTAWVKYLMGQCGNDESCPKKGCPMMSAEECRAACDEIKDIVDEHLVMNATVEAIHELRKEKRK